MKHSVRYLRKGIVRCVFAKKCMVRKQIGKICLKKLFKNKELCYSISEADRRFLRELTGILSVWSKRRNESHKQSFNIRWTDFTEEEL